MEEVLMLNLAMMIVVMMALPWMFIIFTPIIIVAMLGPMLLLNLAVNKGWRPKNYFFEFSNLRQMVLQHIGQWPEDVHAYARTVEHKGKVSLMIQFTSPNARWNSQSHGLSLQDAVFKMKQKLRVSPIPQGSRQNHRFDRAPTHTKMCDHFIEIFPSGLCKTDNEVGLN